MKTIEWIFRVILYLSIILAVILVLAPGSNDGMAGLGMAVGLGVLFAAGGFSLMVLVVIGIMNYLRNKNVLNVDNQSAQGKHVKIIKIVALLIAFAALAIIVVPMLIWAVESFRPGHATCTTLKSGEVFCRPN